MERIYLLWLVTKFNGAKAKIDALIEQYGSAEGVYREKSYGGIRYLTDKEKTRLLDKDLTLPNKIIEETARVGGKIIAIDDDCYPMLLKQIHNPPQVIYIKGKVPSLDDVLAIGIVGTRRISDYGRMITGRISAELAEAGAVTVSGMAAGADAIGAWATIEEGGIAVGVIGSGIDRVYPPENADLYAAIAEKGCILTEFPPGTAPMARNFPIRNRIIAGLSRGVLVTEAPEKSGALITAQFAMEEGRDVFAVPGNVADKKYSGTNKLIQQGAKLVMSARDILSEYPYAERHAPIKPVMARVADAAKPKTGLKPRKETPDRLSGLGEREKAITLLLEKKDMQIDEMARELGISVGELNTKLIMLEMKGAVQKMPGSKYKLRID